MAYRNKSFILECSWNEPQKVNQITLSTYLNTSAYIFPPEYIHISGGMDQTSVKTLYHSKPVKLKEDRGADFDYHRCNINASAISHIRIVVQPLDQIPVWHQGKGEKGWFFIDEVVIN
jgi:hypothetical protein